MRVLIATSNQGKLRDFAGAAAVHGIVVEALRDFAEIPEAVEDGATFEENARKKSEHYSRYAPGELVLADDSGLSVDALHGEPGVHSARYAAAEVDAVAAGVASHFCQQRAEMGHRAASIDSANNAKLLRELERAADGAREASFVCVISTARDGRELAHFRGEVRGTILHQPRGSLGFGYDPLFYLPSPSRSFAELTPEEKALVSHRGIALAKFLFWARQNGLR